MKEIRIEVSWAMGNLFVATAVHNGVKMRSTSECGARSAATNLALRAFYGGNTKDYRAMAKGLRVESAGTGFCAESFWAILEDAPAHSPSHVRD
jgi:hypothetical protein